MSNDWKKLKERYDKGKAQADSIAAARPNAGTPQPSLNQGDDWDREGPYYQLTSIPAPSTFWGSEKFDADEWGPGFNEEYMLKSPDGSTNVYYRYSTPTPNRFLYVPKNGGSAYFEASKKDSEGGWVNSGTLGVYAGEADGSNYNDYDIWKIYQSYIAGNEGKLPVAKKQKKEQGGNLNTMNRKEYFKEGGRFVRKNQNPAAGALQAATYKPAPAITPGAQAAPGASLAVPAMPAATPVSRYERNSALLGNTEGGPNWSPDKGANDANAYAGANGHMGRREMKRFNKEQALGMNRQQRRAFRRALNGSDAKAGDQGIINGYYEGLMRQSKPAAPGAAPGAAPKPAAPADPTAEEIKAIQTQALQKGWNQYKPSEGYNTALAEVKDMAGLLGLAQKAGVGQSWSEGLAPAEEGKELTPEQQQAWLDAYAGSLNYADYNAYADVYNNLNGDAADLTKKNVYDNVNDWMASDEARSLYQNAVNPESIQEYRANAAKAAELKAMQSLGVKFKKGGKMDKFQNGGTAAPDMQAQVDQLVQAAMAGDEKATQTINKIMEAAKAGDQQAMQIAQMIQASAEKMKQSAKRGAKLDYLHSLSSGCPAGTEAKYYKKGGHICKACVEKAKKAQEGTELPAEKCGGKAKKKYFGGSVDTKKTPKACSGAKATKHENGGILNSLKALFASKK